MVVLLCVWERESEHTNTHTHPDMLTGEESKILKENVAESVRKRIRERILRLTTTINYNTLIWIVWLRLRETFGFRKTN